MESIPAVLLTAFLFLGQNRDLVVIFFWTIWTAHYVNRAWAWPNRANLNQKLIPLSVVFLAIFFNTINCFLNGIWLFELSDGYEFSWFRDPRFIIGISIFFLGMIINIKSDDILFSLRDDGSTGYKIPRGGLFEKVSSPNYFGEIMLWTGITIMSIPSFSGLNFLALFSPVFTYLLLNHISGVRILEARGNEKWGNLNEYQEYKKQTPKLIPKIFS